MNDLDILHIHHLILSIGSIAKGFPDFCASENYVPSWHPIFRDAFKFICQILERLPNQNLIRESVRFSLQRLVGCMGTAIMTDIIPIIKAGVLTGGSNGSSKELLDFLSFLGVLMFKFRTGFYPLLNEIIIPLHERAVYLINKQPLGTDDVMESLEVKRAYVSFLGNILNSDLDLVLTSDCKFVTSNDLIVNIHLLSSLLDLLLRALVDFSDGQSQKIVCAVLVKMVIVWGTDPENSLLMEKNMKKPNSPLTTSKNRLLSGFDEFIYKSILPILFRVPFEKNTFNLDDGQIQVFLTELSSLHRTIYISQGAKYLTYLTTFAFPSYGISAESSKSFISALSTMEPKNFKKFLQEFIRNHQKA